jgi:hypothetical protein
VHQVPRRIDVVIFIAGVGECFAAMGCEVDDQSRRKKGLHVASLGIVTADSAAVVEKMTADRRTLDDTGGVHLQHRALELR